MDNTLYYGDNLNILRDHIASASVDLVYLDPPFNSNRNYNVLFREESGAESEAQITAFEDTWHWDRSAEATYHDLVTGDRAPERVSKMVAALRDFIGPNQMMAYLVMMAARLVELHRVLNPTGSLYLHCDPTASHYLKLVLDTIFEPQNFRSEIIWERQSSHNDAKRKYAAVTDTILFYTKSDKYVFNAQYVPYDVAYAEGNFRYTDEHGRRYSSSDLRSPNPRPNLTYDYKGYKPHANGWAVSLERMQELDRQGRLIFPNEITGRIRVKRYLEDLPGSLIGNLWTDIQMLQSQAAERLGYPTQKPLALLERIIKASSNPGDIVLDPFAGCGTSVAAAQKLGRRWIGIDITYLSISLLKYRLENMYGKDALFKVVGEPEDLSSARNLAQDDRYQFQWWALSLVRAKPLGGSEGSKTGKKGSDKGIDGVINFIDDNTGKPKRVLVQVKSGGVKSGDIRDLVGTINRENAALGVFITLEPSTSDMRKEAVSAGYYNSPAWGRDFPRIQILTIEELLSGKEIEMPPQFGTFKQAGRVRQVDEEQGAFDLG